MSSAAGYIGEGYLMESPRTKAMAATPTPHWRRYDWTGVDLTQNTASIVKQLGCTREAVRLQREKVKREAMFGRKPPSRFDWPNIDWSEIDEVIAAKLGCTPGYVCARRRKFAPAEHRA